MSPLILALAMAGAQAQSTETMANGTATAMELPIAIVPEPVQIERLQGEFHLTADTKIVASSHESGVYGVASYLSDLLKDGFARPPQVTLGDAGAAPKNAIVLTTSGADPTLGEEGYELRVTPDQILLKAPTDTGLSRGVQTLRQLFPPEFEEGKHRASWQVPSVYVRDWPRYKWRGALIDCCRHFLDKAFVKRAIDLLAYHKMNVLHWHLTEDQGWRIEIKKYPKLTQVGAFRGADKYGGFYTQEDIREVVAYAKTRHVTIVPEIEMPGHALAALASYPELSCTGGPFEVGTQWGVYSDVYCAGNDKTLAFVQDVLSEVIDLFPSAYIHIGGDEVPKSRWQACPKCQARIKAEGLKDEGELQSWFIRKVEAFLNSRGKKLIGWDEILEGGLSPNATVQSWRSMAGGITAAKDGHDVIMSPTSHCYINRDNVELPLDKVYSFEPTPAELSFGEGGHVLGGEGTLWSERIPQERFDRQAFPRLAALSEVFWSPKEKRHWEDFSARMTRHLERLDALGVHYYLPQPKFLGKQAIFTGSTKLQFETPPAGADIVYTLDGSAPTAKSARYTGPVTVSQSVRVRAATLWHGRALSEEVSRDYEKQVPMEPSPPLGPVELGLVVRYFEGTWASVPDFSKLTPIATSQVKRIGLESAQRAENYGLEFTGFLDAPAEGVYTFSLSCDDGAKLWIGSTLVVNNDGIHPTTEVSGQIALKKGLHGFRVAFFQASQAATLNVKWQPPTNGKAPLEGALFKARSGNRLSGRY